MKKRGTEGEGWKKEKLEEGPAEKEKVNRIALLFIMLEQ